MIIGILNSIYRKTNEETFDETIEETYDNNVGIGGSNPNDYNVVPVPTSTILPTKTNISF